MLTKNDDFKDYINKDSKVRPEADGRISITVEFNTFVVILFSPNFSVTRLKQYSTRNGVEYFSETQKFPDFLETFLGNFHTICPRFLNFRSLLNGNRLIYFVPINLHGCWPHSAFFLSFVA